MVKVDFGGTGHGGEWVTVNVDGQGVAHPAPDIVADISSGFEMHSHFSLNSIDEAQCIATFEHLPAHKLVPTLRLWHALSQAGGATGDHGARYSAYRGRMARRGVFH